MFIISLSSVIGIHQVEWCKLSLTRNGWFLQMRHFDNALGTAYEQSEEEKEVTKFHPAESGPMMTNCTVHHNHDQTM